MICDAHIHFFSPGFFAGLGTDRDTITNLGWEFPNSTEELGVRWVRELDRHGVDRAALMASLPGDADSVAKAVALNPDRFVGFFMLDPTRKDAIDYAQRALDEGLRTICLFPAMHRYPLYDERVPRCSSWPHRVEVERSTPSPSSRIAVCCRSAFERNSGCRARTRCASATRSISTVTR